jgi:membrane protease YdiL (CAAX protease family)
MQILIAATFLSLILALLCPALQGVLRIALSARPALVFLAPVALSAVFCGFAGWLGGLTPALAVLILAYTLAPSVVAFLIRHTRPPALGDFGIMLLLWLPLEFAVGRLWVPRPVQGLLHTAAYGVSVTLGLILFLLFRRLDGMKYNLPRNRWDLFNPLIGFAVSAPVLIPVGRAIGFLPPVHAPSRWSPLALGLEFLVILAGTALPEEILFRGLIQNSLMQKLGSNAGTLVLAALIFGSAHLDNGPGRLPNWRYMIVATIAGCAYGRAFQKSSSVLASAGLHALVNTIKHSFF